MRQVAFAMGDSQALGGRPSPKAGEGRPGGHKNRKLDTLAGDFCIGSVRIAIAAEPPKASLGRSAATAIPRSPGRMLQLKRRKATPTVNTPTVAGWDASPRED